MWPVRRHARFTVSVVGAEEHNTHSQDLGYNPQLSKAENIQHYHMLFQWLKQV